MKMFSHSLPVRARQLLKAPYTERYVRCCERTAVNHRLLLDFAVCKNKSVCVIIKLNNIEFGESSMLTSKMEYMGDATWWDERFRNRKNVLMLPEEKIKIRLEIFC